MSIANLIGFSDSRVGYSRTKTLLKFDGQCVQSQRNGQRYGVGEFEFLRLSELRSRVAGLHSAELGKKKETLPNWVYHNQPVGENVQEYMKDSAYNLGLFQVASQFNLLEMADPSYTPEDGVDMYWLDNTQGPACAKATLGATLFRNYFVEHDGRVGQSKEYQLNGLRELLTTLGLEQDIHYLFENGYIRLTKDQLHSCASKISAMGDEQRTELMGNILVGIHWGCQVNDAKRAIDQRVSLVLCSALPLGAYARDGVFVEDAEALGRLVQDGMQEATLLAGVLNQHRFGSSDLILTKLGHGVFGNPTQWVVDARNRALDLYPFGLRVLQFHYHHREPEFNF